MSDEFRFDDPFYPVPSEAVEADPEALVRELIDRVSRSERALDEQRAQAIAERRELLLDLVSLADDVGTVVERYGVTSNAREAAIIRGIVPFGKKLFGTLRQQGVEPVNAIGEVLDPRTSDVVGSEAREGVSAGRVLREVQVGYTWPHGLLRRARVIVSAGIGATDADTPAEDVSNIAGAGPALDKAGSDQASSSGGDGPQTQGANLA
jgi:molecular chaperone GrpE (heat shock protein)